MNSPMKISSALALATAAFASVPLVSLATNAHATLVCPRRVACDDTSISSSGGGSEATGGGGDTGSATAGTDAEPAGAD